MDELTKEFLSESHEGLDRMERCLTELETHPGDRRLVDEIFRAVHTIKGATGFLGFSRLEALAHAGENLLGALRSGAVAVTPELISCLLHLLDGLRSILQLIESTGGEGQRSTDEDYELIACILGLYLGGPGAGTSPAAADATEPQADSAAPGVPAIPNTLPPAAAASPFAQLEAEARQLQAADDAERRILTQAPELSLRVDIDVLNRMMNLAGELVLTRNQILQTAGWADEHPELARRLDAITSDLRNVAMDARMQPLSHLFGKFPRLVRDLAHVCGRQVRLECEGQGTELDKTLLEAVRDPLTHAIRNAIDHGLEPPDERVREGKSSEGILRLRAYSQNGAVIIEVADDGRGISTDRVLARALESGMVSPERAGQMTPAEITELLFEPGFSTADTVTSVSGRGVGLDVVRSNVEKVGGSVEIESWRGVGTALRLRMPLTLAIVPALILRSSGRKFAIPQNAIRELVFLSADEIPEAIETIGSAQLFRLRGRLHPLVHLREILALSGEPPAPGVGIYIALVEADSRRYALVLDDLLAPEEIVVKPISPVLRESGAFLAATVLGSGEFALILDIGGLGARAGVLPAGHALPLREAVQPVLFAEPEDRFVVYEAFRGTRDGSARERIALPLAAVERIETIDAAGIQFAAGRRVLRYRDELLPLEDDGPALDPQSTLSASSGQTPACAELTVLICHAPRRAILVHRVLDICCIGGRGAGAPDLALIDDHITTVRPPPTTSRDAFQEVA